MLRMTYPALLLSTLLTTSAAAVPFSQVRIGDQDGFGYGAATGLFGADGVAANRNVTGALLDQGDLLPDLNRDGFVATTSRDDFDNRNAEIYSCVGCALGAGMAGVAFTDIALSTSYDNSSANGLVYNANTGTYGAGGTFPSAPSTTLSNQPGFVFAFSVATGDIDPLADVFFNLIFGDYDVVPAGLVFTRADGSTFTQALTVQAPTADGLIQSAFATLAFSDVFTAIVGGFSGYLGVDFNAPNEPYTAFDFVELAVTPISVDPTPVPAPAGALLIGLLMLVSGRWLQVNRAAS